MDSTIDIPENKLDFRDPQIQASFLKVGIKDQIILAIAYDLFRQFGFPVNFNFYAACENLDPKHFRTRVQLALTRLENVTKLFKHYDEPYKIFRTRLELIFRAFRELYHAQQEGSNVFTLVEIYLDFCGATLPTQATLRLFLDRILGIVDLKENESEALIAVFENFTSESGYKLLSSKEIIQKLPGWKNTRFSKLISRIIEALTNPGYSNNDNDKPPRQSLLSQQAEVLTGLSSFDEFLKCLSPEEKSLAIALVRLQDNGEEVTISSILKETCWPDNESSPSKIAYLRKSIEEKLEQIEKGEFIVVYENGKIVPSHSPRVALFIILTTYRDTFDLLLQNFSLNIRPKILEYILEFKTYMGGSVVVINSNEAISTKSANGRSGFDLYFVNRSINKLTMFCRKLVFIQLFVKYKVWFCHGFFTPLQQHDNLLYPFLKLPTQTPHLQADKPDQMRPFQDVIELILKLAQENFNLLLSAMIKNISKPDQTDQILLDWVINTLE